LAEYKQSWKPNKKIPVWAGEVRAPFKKVIAYDALFLGFGILIGAGIISSISLGLSL
jgi:hypothetical protein